MLHDDFERLTDAAIVERLLAQLEVAIHLAEEAGDAGNAVVGPLRERRRDLVQAWLAPVDGQLGLPW